MTNYEKYKAHLRKITDINLAAGVLHWDQEVNMPPKGADFRAQQLATLSEISHNFSVDVEYGKLLEKLDGDSNLSEDEIRNVEISLKAFRKSQKYTAEFVKNHSITVSEAFQAWDKAKKENNFSIFQPMLEKLVELKREECKLLGYSEHPYDALLDQYEPDTKSSDIEKVFQDIKEKLVPFVKELMAQKQNEDAFMYQRFEQQKQWDFGIDLLKQMGYDFESGRQDLSSHPFSIHFSAQDVRITTRIDVNNLNEMIWSCIHEGGHALYEQGMLKENYGLPLGKAISLGIHESQSRLWENNVGRGLPYWKANFRLLQSYFPEELKAVNAELFYKAMNVVKPSLIRTNADELTYHLHVMIRFEIEKALIEASIEVKDLPSIWNAKYKEYLNIDVPSDSKGVLQDIHWSHGSFGYFPTYSLGSFYAIQFYNQAKEEITDLEQEIEQGNMQPLLAWLRKNVHRYGKKYSAQNLCKKITGEKLNFEHFLSYAKEKYKPLYNL
ncbi:MAG: carboxypeptidase [Flavobacteriales bacterium]|nr:carboxypeptidase [Flavobacteriales bacterium]